MEPRTIEQIWDYYREFCITQGATSDWNQNIESVSAFLSWLERKVKNS